MSETILLIDDEPSVHDVVSAYLRKDGFEVVGATEGRAGMALAERIGPSLVVLDLMLPDLSGEDICREIRSRSDVPILMLTARASEEERVRGLALGADDYLTKPFSPRELVARVHAILRRARSDSPLVATLSFDSGRLEIDTVAHIVRVEGREVDLTPSEYRLLVALARYPGRAYSRFELVNHVQGFQFDGFERVIDAHVKNLRRKLERDPRKPRYVETVYGIGYRLTRR